MLRSIARNVARVNMKKKGYSRINKKEGDGRSFFSKHWREFVRGSNKN